MMSTLPSPPISPTDTSYTDPSILMTLPTVHHRSRQRKEYQRHPPRRENTFELVQALVKEHQRLEQQEYDKEVREAPTLLCTSHTPKGILMTPTHDTCPTAAQGRSFATTLSSSQSSSPSSPPRSPALVRFAAGPPKVYRYPKLPIHHQEP
ncbi:hypothetical protein BC941DRAFT_421576 [Chlamydoabsidia padenii]|nr:hypothetical protein BC941DRAFT_421576 [Chlamydoabsidia padenii]